MNEQCGKLLFDLSRTTLFLSLTTCVGLLILWACRCRSPDIHRLVCFLALAQGLVFVRIPCAVPWTVAPGNQEATTRRAHLSDARWQVDGLSGSEDGPPATGNTDRAWHKAPENSSQIALQPLQHVWKVHWPAVVAALWMAGMAVVAGVWICRYVRFTRGLPHGQLAPLEWQKEWAELTSTMRRRPPIEFRVTDNLGPMLVRWRRRYLLLVPRWQWGAMSRCQRMAILRHELGHYQRGDLWESLAVRLMALPHWFNPCSWMAVRRFDEAAEWSCDQLAIAQVLPATEYARTLLTLCEPMTLCESITLCESTVTPGACMASAHGNGVSRRIRRLLLSQPTEDSVMKKAIVCAAAGLLVLAGAVRVQLVGQEAAVAEPALDEAQILLNAPRRANESAAPAVDGPARPAADVEPDSTPRADAVPMDPEAAPRRREAFLDEFPRALERHSQLLATNCKRYGSAQKQVAALERLNEANVATIDLLLDAQRRACDAELALMEAAQQLEDELEAMLTEVRGGRAGATVKGNADLDPKLERIDIRRDEQSLGEIDVSRLTPSQRRAFDRVLVLTKARSRALETWRRVYRRHVEQGAEGDPAPEAQAREQYFLFRKRLESSLSEFKTGLPQ